MKKLFILLLSTLIISFVSGQCINNAGHLAVNVDSIHHMKGCDWEVDTTFTYLDEDAEYDLNEYALKINGCDTLFKTCIRYDSLFYEITAEQRIYNRYIGRWTESQYQERQGGGETWDYEGVMTVGGFEGDYQGYSDGVGSENDFGNLTFELDYLLGEKYCVWSFGDEAIFLTKNVSILKIGEIEYIPDSTGVSYSEFLNIGSSPFPSIGNTVSIKIKLAQ